MEKIKLGILGMSEGNGHPYSWSAIFNGYNEKEMKHCPFPVIPEYLSKQTFPDAQIKDAHVTHIWTQERKISEHIARASNIPNIVDDYTELIGKVDAVLLARDDYQNHKKMAAPFLKAGIPVYVDKPIAATIKEAEEIYALDNKDNIFTCSAIQYAQEFNLDKETKERIGHIKHSDMIISGPWDRYSIHIIEPILRVIGHERHIKNSKTLQSADQTTLWVEWTDGTTSSCTTTKAKVPIQMRVLGDKGFEIREFKDTYNAFKSALQHFIDCVQHKKGVPDKKFVLKAVELIERGL